VTPLGVFRFDGTVKSPTEVVGESFVARMKNLTEAIDGSWSLTKK